MNTREAAHYLGCSEAYLNIARHRGCGPPYIRPDNMRKILYDKLVLDEWMKESTHHSTAEYNPPEAHRKKQSPGRPPNGNGARQGKANTANLRDL